jgi:hypothetical protein
VNKPTDAEILDWLEAHGISVRIQQNERQSFMIAATRDAIRFEMTAGNVALWSNSGLTEGVQAFESSPNIRHEPRPTE